MENIFLVISVLVNLVFILYARWLINIIKTKEEDVTNLSEVIAEYVGHVKGVHEMEMFYGDQTLKSLIDHGKNMIDKIENFDYLILEREDDAEEVKEG